MTDDERQAFDDELTSLRRKLRAREGQGGYATNVAELKVRIAEIEAALAQ